MWTSSLVLGLLLTASSGTPTPPETPSGSATVPLQELLPLYAKRTEQEPPAPPTDALVVKSQLKGRLTADALLVEAHFEVEVLASGRWTRVRLLQLDAGTYLTELPSLENATVGALEGQLSLVTREPGRYAFDVSLALRPAASGGGAPVPGINQRLSGVRCDSPAAVRRAASATSLPRACPWAGRSAPGAAPWPRHRPVRGWSARSPRRG